MFGREIHRKNPTILIRRGLFLSRSKDTATFVRLRIKMQQMLNQYAMFSLHQRNQFSRNLVTTNTIQDPRPLKIILQKQKQPTDTFVN